MREFTDIVSRWLWRFYPMIWLNWVIGRFCDWALRILEDEGHRMWLSEDKANCAQFGGWLALAEERLNEVIAYRAMKHLKRPYWGPQPFGHVPARAVTSLEEVYLRLTRLICRYCNVERLARLRAQKLQRLFEARELQLEVIHHPVELQPAAAAAGIPAAAAAAAVFSTAPVTGESSPDPRIRAPPRPASSSANQPTLNPRDLLARTRAYARCRLPVACRRPRKSRLAAAASSGGLTTL